MFIGIFGSEENRWNPKTKEQAIATIRQIITYEATSEIPIIVSGHCPKGGVDIWAEDMADKLKLAKLIFPAEVHQWDGGGKIGFKQRNIQAAQACDTIYVIVPANVPEGFTGPPWERKSCHHCGQRSQSEDAPGAEDYRHRHIQSGACWTAWYAIENFRKKAKWIVI